MQTTILTQKGKLAPSISIKHICADI